MQARQEELNAAEIPLPASPDTSSEDDSWYNLFSHDNDNNAPFNATDALSTLCSLTSFRKSEINAAEFRDKCVAIYAQNRNSDLYKTIKSKLDNNQKVKPEEFLYYAMVTDNPNTLDLRLLESLRNTYHYQNFDNNLQILIAARRWQEAKEPVAKKILNDELREALNARGYLRTNCEMFLNLRGINLSGADLRTASLDFVDLGGANLSNCNLYCTEIHCTNLDNANLSNNDHDEHRPAGPRMRFVTARRARFDGVRAASTAWTDSDFTGSSFKNAGIGEGCFTNTVFDHCDFTGGFIMFSGSYLTHNCSLKYANLAQAVLFRPDYDQLDLTGAAIFPADAFQDGQSLWDALDVKNDTVMRKLRLQECSPAYRTAQINAYQEIVAANILYHLRESAGMSMRDKADMIDKIRMHDIFDPETLTQRAAYYAEHTLFRYFTVMQHEPHATKAHNLLEESLDIYRIAAICPH